MLFSGLRAVRYNREYCFERVVILRR